MADIFDTLDAAPATPPQESGNTLGSKGGDVFDAVAPKPKQSGDVFDAIAPKQQAGDVFDSLTAPRPVTGQPKETEPEDDPNAPWYKKAWNWANNPLIDSQHISNWLGDAGFNPESGWGKGLKQGVSELASGFTSPLSLALTIGFLPGGLVESGGVAALRAAGMSAEEIGTVLKGSEVVSNAVKAGRTEEEALQAAHAAGFSRNVLESGYAKLKEAGITPESLYNHGIVHQVGSAALRSVGASPAVAEKTAQGINALMEAGFTAQAAYGAVMASPRVLDALREGDYESASRYGVEALGGAAFAYLGAKHTIKEAGALSDELGYRIGAANKPSEAAMHVRNQFDIANENKVRATRAEELWAEEIRKKYKGVSDDDLHRIFNWIQAGQDESTMAQRHDYLAEAAGKGEAKIPAAPPKPEILSAITESAGDKPTPEINPKEETALSTERPSDQLEAKNDAREKVSDFLGRAFLRMQREAQGQEVLDDMEEKGISPAEEGRRFWEKTYFNLPAIGQERFQRYLFKETGFKPGDTIGFTKDKEPIIARDWAHIASTILDLPSSAADLEGTTRGLVALMKLANDRFSGKPEERFRLPEAQEPQEPSRPSEPSQTPLPAGRPENTPEDRIKELVAQQKLKSSPNYTDEERQALLDAYDPSKLTDDHKALAKEIADKFSEHFEKAQKAGVLGEAARNYVTQLWGKDGENNDALNSFNHESRGGGFSVYTSMARHRTFENAFEGELLGKKLAVTDPIALARHNGTKLAEVAENRAVVDRLRDSGVRASDGRPVVALSGAGYPVTGPDGTNPAVLVNPDIVRSIRISKNVVDGLKASGKLDRLLKIGAAVDLGPDKHGNTIYAWDPHDYRNIDHSAFKGWNMATSAPDGTPVMVKGDLVVHPEAYEYLNRQIGGEKSVLSSSGLGKATQAVAREAKSVLLAFSPFHFAQEGLRAIMSGISPFSIYRWDLRNDPELSMGVRKGLTLGTTHSGLQDFQEGLTAGKSWILSRTPGVSSIYKWMDNMLFEKYIPGLKARAYKELATRYQKAYPDWSSDKVAEVAAQDTNERFGGINYKRIGRSVATQDLFRLVALAPDWLESEVRFMARSFGEEGKVARADIAKMAVGLFATSRVLNYITSGKPHNEAPFGVVLKGQDGREKVYSIRTIPTDMMHAISDPSGFLAGRVSPLGRTAAETYTGRDSFGRKLSRSDLFVNLLRQAAPIPAQTVAKLATGEQPDLTSADAAAKSAGFTVFPYKTEAQKMAAKMASDHSPTGEVDPSALRRHQAIIEYEDRLRNGQIQPNDLHQMLEQGVLTKDDVKTVLKNVKDTKEMDPEMARLWSRAQRLGMKEFLQVWGAATPGEKASLSKLLITKRKNYFKKVGEEMTNEERLRDPSYIQLRKMFPNEQPF